MINVIKKSYILSRVAEVDEDFLAHEESMISPDDLTLVFSLLQKGSGELPNPYNSIILYVTGLSNKFDFLKARSDTTGGSQPDIDIDVSSLERDKLLKLIVDRWGRENVANIITYGTFKPKSLTHSFYRVTEGDTRECNKILASFPQAKYGKEATLAEIIEQNPDIKKHKDFYTFAKRLEGSINTLGVHAAGLIISDFPISDVLSVKRSAKFKRLTQFDMKECEKLGMIKMDLLSLNNLDVIALTKKLVETNYDIDLGNLYQIPDGDPRTYTMLHLGLLTGVFQMETSGMAKNLIMKIKPTSIHELSDINSINRPGPLQAHYDKEYIKNKRNGYAPEDMPSQIAEILKDSYWVLLYQEQLMKICSDVAGFSLREADDIRRAMGKKDTDLLKSFKEQFVVGCEDKLTQEYTEKLWGIFIGYSSYGFGAGHSTAYAMIAYVCAYLKANYPSEFFTALMTVRSKTLQPKLWAEKAPEFIQEAKTLGVTIKAPSINYSSMDFTLAKNEIYFGFNAIRDVGITAAKCIQKARGKTIFKDVYDFVDRVNTQKVTTKTFQSLVQAGAFDRMGYIRQELLDGTPALYGYVKDIVEYEQRKIDIVAREAENQKTTALVDTRNALRKEIKAIEKKLKKDNDSKLLLEKKKLEEILYPLEEMQLRRLPPLKEKEKPVQIVLSRSKAISLSLEEIMQQAYYIGCYTTSHPATMISGGKDKLTELWTGQRANVCGIVNSCKEITTKKGLLMAFLEIDDSTRIAEVIVFPKLWKKLGKDNLGTGSLLSLDVKVEKEEPVLKLIAEDIKIYKE